MNSNIIVYCKNMLLLYTLIHKKEFLFVWLMSVQVKEYYLTWKWVCCEAIVRCLWSFWWTAASLEVLLPRLWPPSGLVIDICWQHIHLVTHIYKPTLTLTYKTATNLASANLMPELHYDSPSVLWSTTHCLVICFCQPTFIVSAHTKAFWARMWKAFLWNIQTTTCDTLLCQLNITPQETVTMVCAMPPHLQYVEFSYVWLAEGSNEWGKVDMLTNHQQSPPDIMSLGVTKDRTFHCFLQVLVSLC